ncbi:MAG: (2Fe-2S)-binding protein [Alphaproteobacteria bacterium]|jgi:nicotinate dehydrogenase subunit A
MVSLSFTLNGQAVSADAADDTPLLYVLRNDLGCTSVRFGCGLEQCGCCAVLVDGVKTFACTLPSGSVQDKAVETVEGLGDATAPNPIQQAFLDEQAGQCGYCLSGLMIATKALLAANANPTRPEIRAALDEHLCRCGAHTRIVRAVERAAEALR